MTLPMPSRYYLDPADPRAPSQEEWDRMSPREQERVVEMLPFVVPEELMPPEGDTHLMAKIRPRLTLDGFFRRTGRRVYVSGELNVYYPAERLFAPDLFAVLDVSQHDRQRWVVSYERKGLDFALEVHFEGNWAKDYEINVERYARLGIQEYFIFDCRALRLTAYRLPPPGAGERRAYLPIVPQGGRYTSAILGLDIQIEGARLRFLHEGEPVLDDEELVATLTKRVDDLLERHRYDEDAARRDQLRLDLKAFYEARFGTLPATVVDALHTTKDMATLQRWTAVFATRSADEIEVEIVPRSSLAGETPGARH